MQYPGGKAHDSARTICQGSAVHKLCSSPACPAGGKVGPWLLHTRCGPEAARDFPWSTWNGTFASLGAGWGATSVCLAFKSFRVWIFPKLQPSGILIWYCVISFCTFTAGFLLSHQGVNEEMKFTKALHAVLRFMVCFLLGLLMLTQCYCQLSCCCGVTCEADGKLQLWCHWAVACVPFPSLQSFECFLCWREKSVQLEHDMCTVHLALLKLSFRIVLTQFAHFFPFLEFLKTWIQYSCFSKNRLSVWSLIYHHKWIIHSCRSDSSLTWYIRWA